MCKQVVLVKVWSGGHCLSSGSAKRFKDVPVTWWWWEMNKLSRSDYSCIGVMCDTTPGGETRTNVCSAQEGN